MRQGKPYQGWWPISLFLLFFVIAVPPRLLRGRRRQKRWNHSGARVCRWTNLPGRRERVPPCEHAEVAASRVALTNWFKLHLCDIDFTLTYDIDADDTFCRRIMYIWFFFSSRGYLNCLCMKRQRGWASGRSGSDVGRSETCRLWYCFCRSEGGNSVAQKEFMPSN